MRPLKFRAWNHTDNEMIYFSLYDVWKQKMGNFPLFEFKTHNSKNKRHETINIMQYTGLKDKNGKEIYEGDILNKEHTYTKIVVEYGCQQVDAFELMGYNFSSFIGDYNKNDCARLSSEIEVIGNIYENKEVLDATEKRNEPENN